MCVYGENLMEISMRIVTHCQATTSFVILNDIYVLTHLSIEMWTKQIAEPSIGYD